MVPILFRAFSTVVTVVIAVGVAAQAGETASGKIWAAVLIAAVVGLVEWLLVWAPKHSALARRLLDPRAQMVGVYVQDVKMMFGTGRGARPDNRFAVFWVDARGDGEYGVTGFAYNSAGGRYADFRSEGMPEFSKDGLSMTYRWDGEFLNDSDDGQAPDSKGVAQVDLHSCTGRVDNVGMDLALLFDLHRVDRAWLDTIGLGQLDPSSLKRADGRDEFARAYAAHLATKAGRASVEA